MESAPDAIALLKKDHADMKKLFKQFERSESTREKDALATRICEMLTVHALCEDELVYPAARNAFDDEDRQFVNEATIEHDTARDLIGQIEGMRPGDEMFDAAVKVLGEYINHHIEEEEGEIFPRLRHAEVDLHELGRRFAQRKEQLIDGFEFDDRRSTLRRAKIKHATRV